MGLFRAITRLFSAFGYLLTGNIDGMRKSLLNNTKVIEATYDNIIEQKVQDIKDYKDAVSRTSARKETILIDLKDLSKAIQDAEAKKEGAAIKAKELVAKIGVEDVKTHPDYIRFHTAYQDYANKLVPLQERYNQLEEESNSLEQIEAEDIAQLSSLVRELESLKGEKDLNIAAILSAKEREEIANMRSGLTQKNHNKELQEIREMTKAATARAKISRKIAGIETAKDDSEFLLAAQKSKAEDEFDRLIGIAKKEEAPVTPDQSVKVPE